MYVCMYVCKDNSGFATRFKDFFNNKKHFLVTTKNFKNKASDVLQSVSLLGPTSYQLSSGCRPGRAPAQAGFPTFFSIQIPLQNGS